MEEERVALFSLYLSISLCASSHPSYRGEGKKEETARSPRPGTAGSAQGDNRRGQWRGKGFSSVHYVLYALI